MKTSTLYVCLGLLTTLPCPANSTPSLLGVATLKGSEDKSGLGMMLENQSDHANVLGGTGSAFSYAGQGRFVALSDRGPNAAKWNPELDNTTSYVSRFHEIGMEVRPSKPGSPLPLSVTPTLLNTTLLWSHEPLHYGPMIPPINTPEKYYFSGRSDNFSDQDSLSPLHARLDPEGICLSLNGKSVFISDEYGPHIYQFNRSNGQRERTFTLPEEFGAEALRSNGEEEVKSNSKGRSANRGIEGLTITPDGKFLVGFVQGPLLQDGGEGGRINRIIKLEIDSGRTEQYVYDNQVRESDTKSSGTKTHNSSEILAINNHEFLVLERDGKGLGDDSQARFKQLFKIDLEGATDIEKLKISGEDRLLPYAVPKTLFLDIRNALNAKGIKDTEIPAKLEGATFGDDVKIGGAVLHTLWISSDNDFLPKEGGDNMFFVFGFSEADLGKDHSGGASALSRPSQKQINQ